jgi:DNA-binding NarL/FixJ family response regulator
MLLHILVASALPVAQNNAAILTDADIRGIRNRIATGVSNAEIAREYGVSSSTISLIKSRKTWSHVT